MSATIDSDTIQVLASGVALDRSRRFDPRRESQIGEEDGRIRVPDPQGLPWRRICQLSFRNGKNLPEVGTGWFAGPRTIITAGHCLWHSRKKKADGKASRMVIIPGRDGEDDTEQDRALGKLKATRFSAHPKWMESRDINFDIGCIHLDEDPNDDIGAWEFASAEDDSLNGACVNVAGYPVVGPNREQINGTELFCHNDRVLAMLGTRLFYSTDTHAGQSGGPVWVLREPDAPPVVVGVHTYGEKKAPEEVGEANSATRLTDGLIDLIDTWVKHEGEEEAFVPAEVARAAGEVPGAHPAEREDVSEPVDADGAGGLALARLRHFANERDPGRGTRGAADDGRESGMISSPVTDITEALVLAVSEVEAMTGRLLRRVRAQQKLDLYASILTLILSSALFAAMQPENTDGNLTSIKITIGLLTIFSAILALVAKRMGGGEGSLLAKYTDLQALAFDARMQLGMLPKEGVTTDGLEKAVETITKLTGERHRLEASDFLFRDGGIGMWLLGVSKDEPGR